MNLDSLETKVRTFFNHTLYIIVLASSLLFAPFAKAVFAEPAGFPLNREPTVIKTLQPTLNVVTELPTPQVSSSAIFPIAATCHITHAGQFQHIQDASAINLNQPATCFTLRPNLALPQAEKLSVKPLGVALVQTVLVVSTPSAYFLPFKAAASIPSPEPLAPLGMWAFLVAGLVLLGKVAVKRLVVFARQNFKYSMQFSELVMMKC